MSLIRKHRAVLQAWACLALVLQGVSIAACYADALPLAIAKTGSSEKWRCKVPERSKN